MILEAIRICNFVIHEVWSAFKHIMTHDSINNNELIQFKVISSKELTMFNLNHYKKCDKSSEIEIFIKKLKIIV